MPGVRRAADRLVRFVPAPASQDARLLDVGCGSGTYMKLMRDLGWHVRGVELDEGAVRTARKAKLDVRQGTMDDLDPEVDGLFDVVTVGHVIEHTHDPIAALRAACAVLKPGGMLWIGTPNLGSLGAHLFRARWRALEPPRHLVGVHRRVAHARPGARRVHRRAVRPLDGLGAVALPAEREARREPAPAAGARRRPRGQRGQLRAADDGGRNDLPRPQVPRGRGRARW